MKENFIAKKQFANYGGIILGYKPKVYSEEIKRGGCFIIKVSAQVPISVFLFK